MNISRRNVMGLCGLGVLATAGCGSQTVTAQAPAEVKPVTVLKSDDEFAHGAFVDGKTCWTLWCSGSSTGVLRQLSASGVAAEFPLNGVGPGSLTTSFAKTADGAVWVANNYLIVRVAGGKLSQWALPTKPEAALPPAYENVGPLAGAWISAISPKSDSSVWVSRVNVPYLVEVSPGGPTTSTLAVPDEFVGSRQACVVDGTVVMAPGWDRPGRGVASLRGASVAVREQPGVEGFDGCVALSQTKAVDLRSGRSIDLPSRVFNPVGQLVRVSAAGSVAWWDKEGNAVLLGDRTVLVLEYHEGVTSRPLIRPVHRSRRRRSRCQKRLPT